MGYASAVLSSTEREFRQSNSKDPASSRGKSGLWTSRSVKGLLLGGLAASCGYSLESSAGKAADVAGFGNLAMPDVSVGGTHRFQDYSPLIRDAEAEVPMSSCMQGIISGGVGSLVVQNPLPLVVGLGGCLSRASAQQRVGNEFQVNTYTNAGQSEPATASFSNGNFVVTWKSMGQDGSNWGIYGQIFDGNANRIGNEFRVNTYTTGSQRYHSVASFVAGNFVVTWSSAQGGPSYRVYGQLFDWSGAKLGNEFQASTYINGSQIWSSVTSFDSGNFVAAWESFGQDGSGQGVFGQLFYGNSTKLGNEFQANTYTTGDQRYPSIASVINEGFAVAWESLGDVYSQLFDWNGTRIGNEFQVNTYDSSQETHSSASFNNGNFVVAWESSGQDGSGYGIYGQLFYGNGTKLGNEFQINTHTNNHQWYPSVDTFSDGNFVVAWSSLDQDGGGWGIYGQLFYGNNTKLGNEFQINTHTANDQWVPSVETFGNGNFVITWVSNGQDGSGDGVYGQLFNQDPPLTSSTTTTIELMTSSSSSTLNSTINPPSSRTDITTITSSSTFSSRTSNQPSSSTREVTSNSSSNPISSTASQLTSTPTTRTITSANLYTGEPSPSGGGSFVLPILLPIVGCICLLTGIGTYLLFKRRNQEEVLPSVELPEEEENSNNDSQYANVSFIPNRDNYANLPEDPSEYPKGYGNVPSDFVED